MNESYDCIIIGGGAAGLYCASKMKRRGGGRGPRVLLLEKSEKLGTKLLMSGGGRCNITHDGSIKEFIEHYGDAGSKIRKLLYSHSNIELRSFLSELGIETEAEGDGRVFPVNRKAAEVRDALVGAALANGIDILKGAAVTGIERIESDRYDDGTEGNPAEKSGGEWLVICTDKYYRTTNIIVATGGCSYPETGSDGSIFEILGRDLGISITDLRPALAPISIRDYKYSDLSGISLDAALTVSLGSESASGYKEKVTKCCSVLFTHDGFSGPAVLNISKYADAGSRIALNYIYPYTYDEARSLLTERMKGSKVSMSRAIAESFGIPSRLADAISKQAGSSTNEAARILTHDEMEVLNPGSFDNAMSTAGGVALSEIDLHTMELLDHKGIYVIGEALDVCGDTGGYNLQFAYSSAACAASSIFEQMFE